MRHFEKLPFSFDIYKLTDALNQVGEIVQFPEDIRFYKPFKPPVFLNEGKLYYQLALTKRPHDSAPECFYINSKAYGIGGENEADYCDFIPEFNHTYFKEVYDTLTEYVKERWNTRLGRIRLIQSNPGVCLAWHADVEDKIHVPIITNEGSRMAIEDEIMHIPLGETWRTNSTKYHSQFNGVSTDRIHLIAAIVPTKDYWLQTSSEWIYDNSSFNNPSAHGIIR